MIDFQSLSGLIHLIEAVGFPIVVTLFLLIRYEIRIERLEKQSRILSDTIHNLRRDIQ
jgi:hypothetical protein